MIPTIDLDKEGFQDIFEKAKKRIPVLYPQWTNYNTSDSGIALLELLSWMKEMQEFHINQIGPSQQEAYLKLLGIKREGRRPSRAVVRCCQVEDERLLPLGTRFLAGDVEFESVEEISLYPGKLAGIRTGRAAGEERGYEVLAGDRAVLALYPFGRHPKPGAFTEYLFDRPFSPDRLYSFQFFIKEDYEVRRNRIEEKDGFLPMARISFEVFTEDGYRPLRIEEDETFGMLQRGIVRIRMPGCPVSPKPQDDLYALRMTFLEGDYDIPPMLKYLDLNAVRVRQQQTLRGERCAKLLGEGTGFPAQRFPLGLKGILKDTVELRIENPLEKGVFEPWSRVEDFHGSGPEDRHFTVDEETDEICFGDGIKGMPPEGRICLTGGKSSRGASGNVKKGQIRLSWEEDLSFKAVNEENSFGGQEPESINDCIKRVERQILKRDYAVTDADYERLVKEVPGLMIHRAKVIRRDPKQNSVVMAATPFSLKQGARLLPGYLSNIRQYMEKRRLLGTKFQILQPAYVFVTLYVNLEVSAYYQEAEKQIEEELYRYFSETQCEFGKPVLLSSIYSFLDSMKCVKRVLGLNMDAAGENVERNMNGDVLLPESGLVLLSQIKSSFSYSG